MLEMIYRQQHAARPLSGRTLLVRGAGIALRLAAAQLILGALAADAAWPGAVLAIYAAGLFAALVHDATASCAATLWTDRLLLERRIGEWTTARLEIPLSQIVSLRPVYGAENLRLTYRRATHIDPASAPGLRVRAAFALSLLSGRLARLTAGRRARAKIGYVLVYEATGGRCACTFRPDETMLAHLQAILCERFGFDERMTREKKRTLYSRALQRAFPALYPYVEALISQEDIAWAQAQRAAQWAAMKRGLTGKKESPKRAQGAAAAETETNEINNPGEGAPRRRRKQG